MAIKLSSDTKVTIKGFIKRVMRPATGKSESSIVKNYDEHDPVRIKYSYGDLEGGEIIEAVNRYPADFNRSVAETKISEIAEEQARLKAKKLGTELESRERIPAELRGEKKRQDIAKMRAKLKQAQEEKLKKEETEVEEKKQRNIKRVKEAEAEVKDMPID